MKNSTQRICQLVSIKAHILKRRLLHTIGRICRMVNTKRWFLIFTLLFFLLGFPFLLPLLDDLPIKASIVLTMALLYACYVIAPIVCVGLYTLGSYLEKY